MKARTITNDIFWLGAIDWDRRLFDSLIPLPDGTSYNAYLITGSEKTALLDTVDPDKMGVLKFQLQDTPHIDYIVIHHAEQDHAGSLPWVLDAYPNAQILTTQKAHELLIDHLHIDKGRIKIVKDGEIISLGNKTLEFIYTPWVHWPETMCTYVKEDKILFSCDLFGSHLATSELYAYDRARVYEAAKRYYAEIMMPFRTVVKKNLDRIAPYNIALIAPSHGPVYDTPNFIIDAYTDWVCSPPRNQVVIPYVSMHGSTQKMVEYLVSALAERYVTVQQFDLARTDIGKLAISLVDAATIVIGTPTFHVGPHPTAFSATHLTNLLRPKLQFASIIGSYGWSSKIVEKITGLIPNLKVEVIPPVICKGMPRENDYKALDALADTIVAKHKQANIF